MDACIIGGDVRPSKSVALMAWGHRERDIAANTKEGQRRVRRILRRDEKTLLCSPPTDGPLKKSV